MITNVEELSVSASLAMPNTPGNAASKITVYSSPCGAQVMADFQQLNYGVGEYADNGAGRFVSSHLGTSYGYASSPANVDIRGLESHAVRGVGTSGNSWAIELGVHSEVAGDTFLKNVGAYIASSSAGWITGAPVRNDSAVVVGGSDGWHHGLLYYDTDGATILFDITSTGQAKSRGGFSVVSESGTFGYGKGSCAGGATAQNIDKSAAVYIDKPTGKITTSPASLAPGATASFVCHNGYISATDNIILNITPAGVASSAAYNVWACPFDGGMIVHLKNISSGSLSEAVNINFTRINGSVT